MGNIQINKLSDQQLINYVSQTTNFDTLLNDISSDFIGDEVISSRNRRDDVLAFWVGRQLKKLCGIYLQGKKVEIVVKPKISGLFYNKKYDVGVEIDGKLALVVNVQYVMTNLSTGFQTIFEEMLINGMNLKCRGIEYMTYNIFPEECPFISNDKTVVKYENLSIQHLIKLTNVAMNKTFPIKNYAYLIGKNMTGDVGKAKNKLKSLKTKPATLANIEQEAMILSRDNGLLLRVKETILKKDIYTFMTSVLLFIQDKIANSEEVQTGDWQS